MRHSLRWFGWLGLIQATCLLCGPAPASKAEDKLPAWGLDDPRVPGSLEPIREFQSFTGLSPLLVAWRVDFSQAFPMDACSRVWNEKRVPLIFWDAVPPDHKGGAVLDRIIRGEFDAYLTRWADDALRFRQPVLVHFLRQFNHSTQPWSIAANEKNASLVSQAFEHVVTLFRERRASNVRWVWGPNIFPLPAAGWNDWTKAYPGDSFVDYVALDGLDFGNSGTVALPMTFEQLFASPIRAMRQLAPRKPILLTSISTARAGEARHAWLKDMVSQLLGQSSSVRGGVWYNHAIQVNWKAREHDAQNLQPLVPRASSSAARDAFLDRPTWSSRLLPPKRESAPPTPTWKIPFVAETQLSKIPSALADAPRLDLDISPATMVGRDFEMEGQFGARFRFGWNQFGLLIWSEITDHTLGDARKEPERIWDGDGLELDIGPPRVPDMDTDMSDCHRILVSPGGERQIKPPVALIRGGDGALNPQLGGISFESQFGISAQSYRLFGIIPWRALGIEPKADADIPFDICITDGFNQHRVRQVTWSGGPHYYHDPSEWGHLRLQAP